uniref:Uncharacterized protein n=1 Tax=Cacopsylla melanoneura TaxID=428564 RepID=A0A8D9BFK4_9HEMI
MSYTYSSLNFIFHTLFNALLLVFFSWKVKFFGTTMKKKRRFLLLLIFDVIPSSKWFQNKSTDNKVVTLYVVTFLYKIKCLNFYFWTFYFYSQQCLSQHSQLTKACLQRISLPISHFF